MTPANVQQFPDLVLQLGRAGVDQISVPVTSACARCRSSCLHAGCAHRVTLSRGLRMQVLPGRFSNKRCALPLPRNCGRQFSGRLVDESPWRHSVRAACHSGCGGLIEFNSDPLTPHRGTGCAASRRYSTAPAGALASGPPVRLPRRCAPAQLLQRASAGSYCYGFVAVGPELLCLRRTHTKTNSLTRYPCWSRAAPDPEPHGRTGARPQRRGCCEYVRDTVTRCDARVHFLQKRLRGSTTSGPIARAQARRGFLKGDASSRMWFMVMFQRHVHLQHKHNGLTRRRIRATAAAAAAPHRLDMCSQCSLTLTSVKKYRIVLSAGGAISKEARRMMRCCRARVTGTAGTGRAWS